MMKSRSLIIFLLIFVSFLSACSPSSDEVEATILAELTAAAPTVTSTSSATNTPEPTATLLPTEIPTSTPIPLSEIDLEPILVLPGDLPAGFSAAQVMDSLHTTWDKYPIVEQVIDQRFQKNGRVSGGVVVLLYEDMEDLLERYEYLVDAWISEGWERQNLGFGEKAVVSETFDTDLVFTRCNAVVHIHLGTEPERNIISYAKRLDERLQELVCR